MVDVFVIGGGPAGLAAAIAARRKGLAVVVADALQPPIDKACGEGLMPDGLAAARALGIALPADLGVPCRGIRFEGEGVSAAADFPCGAGLGIRRTALHLALVEDAERSGVEFRWGCSVHGLNGIDARWIVGADGAASRVRAWAGLDHYRRDSRRYGFRIHYRCAPWSEYVEIHWGNGYQIYVTPVAREQVCVAVISRDSRLRLSEALSQFPVLAGRLRGAPEASIERGSLTASRKLRRVTRGNVALIGDASGSVDAISGEGLGLGFHQAMALADAMARGDLALYEAAHPRLGARPRFMTDFLLTMDRLPWLRRRALPALAARPDVFSGLLAMHVGAARNAEFAANCAALGLRMLTI